MVRRRSVGSPDMGRKAVQPCSWFGPGPEPTRYTSWLLMELGRLGLQINDIEAGKKTVLSDVLAWLSERPGEPFAKLMDWSRLDIAALMKRSGETIARPRIEVSAKINQSSNLRVVWHPRGWASAPPNLENLHINTRNALKHKSWEPGQLDFRVFEGDEGANWGSRSSNELMWIKGVGQLRPNLDSTWEGSRLNKDVVDALLLYAVRSAYDALVVQLELSFEVTKLNDFVFEWTEEPHPDRPKDGSIKRLIGWKLIPTEHGRAEPTD